MVRTRILADEGGSAILEFALVLPLLAVFVVGIFDFSGAFNQKQKVAQAAQEGAILAAAQPMTDIQASNGNPDSLQTVVVAIFNSLQGNGVIPTGTCVPPGTNAGGPTLTWTFSISGCPDNLSIVIQRGQVPSAAASPGQPLAVCTVVTVSYPYHWRFNGVIQLLFPHSSYSATTSVIESATVHNQT